MLQHRSQKCYGHVHRKLTQLGLFEYSSELCPAGTAHSTSKVSRTAHLTDLVFNLILILPSLSTYLELAAWVTALGQSFHFVLFAMRHSDNTADLPRFLAVRMGTGVFLLFGHPRAFFSAEGPRLELYYSFLSRICSFKWTLSAGWAWGHRTETVSTMDHSPIPHSCSVASRLRPDCSQGR